MSFEFIRDFKVLLRTIFKLVFDKNLVDIVRHLSKMHYLYYQKYIGISQANVITKRGRKRQ